MKDNNELNDIILNKGGSANNNKKVILAVATLGVILIIVVMLMNSLTSTGTDNLPQTPLPPEPKMQATQEMKDEPLFEEVEVMQEESKPSDNLDAIAKKLKEESQELDAPEVQMIEEPIVAETKPKPVAKPKPVVKPVTQTSAPTSTSKSYYYIQVGSFSKYAPNKKFLASITDLGYKYKFHKITKNGTSFNKVLVGPFKSSVTAKDARRVLRAKVEPGAFLIKL
ncbi:MAG: SPOR domain-containing protein [Helicobacteraceae bacterium]|nr:SPOR domain-containing protein [Candidatus Sulfurimonas ponti]MBL6973766.1 SPOR domain-containing protein [Sulfurimonas sp.]